MSLDKIIYIAFFNDDVNVPLTRLIQSYFKQNELRGMLGNQYTDAFVPH